MIGRFGRVSTIFLPLTPRMPLRPSAKEKESISSGKLSMAEPAAELAVADAATPLLLATATLPDLRTGEL